MAKNNSQKKANINGVSKEVLQFAEEHGYSYAEITKGYVEKSDTDILGGAVYVEHIHGIEKFNSDEELVGYLETKKGINVLKDLPDCLNDNEKRYFLDTTENKEKVKKAIKEKYNFIWDKLLHVVNRETVALFIKEHKSEYNLTDGAEYTLLKGAGVCRGYRYRDNESIHMTLGENEYFSPVNASTGKCILKDAVESNLITIKESELTKDYIVYTK